MSRRMISVTWAALLLVGGCLPSLSPVYRPDDLVFIPQVLGVWTQPGSQETWEFTKRDANSYRVVYHEGDGKQGQFIACLARIDGQYFLDLYPEDVLTELNGLHKLHLVPMHTIYRVQRMEPTIELSAIDYRWLEQLLKDHPDAIRHARFDGRLLITASTEEVRSFVVAHADQFSASFILERKSGG